MKFAYKIIFTFIFLLHPLSADIVGTWKTIDEKSGKEKSIVAITNNAGVYSGTIRKVLTGEKVCSVCEGKYKNKSLVGVIVIKNVKKEDSKTYGGGTITDPKDDKEYKVTLTEDGDKMIVKGYIGWGALSVGRKQTWYRVK